MPLNLGQLVRAVRQADLIVTPRLTVYLMRKNDHTVSEEVAKKLFDQMVKPGRNRDGSFSSSAAGTCLRRQELAFLGLTPDRTIDPNLMMRFSNGAWAHMRIQALLLDAGILSEIEVPLSWPSMRSMGTIDGLGYVPDDHPREMWRGKEWGFEFKTMNSNVFRKTRQEGPKPEHLRQIHRYFLSGGFDLFCLICECKDTQNWFEWVIEPDPVLIQEQQQELRELNDAIDREQLHKVLPQCAKQTGPLWRDCPFGGTTGQCLAAGTWPVKHSKSAT